MISGNGLRRRLDVREGGQDDRDLLRRRRELDPRLGDDPEHPFGADHRGRQVVAGRPADSTAIPDTRRPAVTNFEAENVVGGHAVLEAMRTARVLGDVAADRAGALARRIGREEIAALAR